MRARHPVVIAVVRRVVGRTEIRIRTDWQTTEDVALRHPGSNDPSPWFLFERRPLEPANRAPLAPLASGARNREPLGPIAQTSNIARMACRPAITSLRRRPPMAPPSTTMSVPLTNDDSSLAR